MNFSQIIKDVIKSEINKIHTALPARIVAVNGMDVDVQPLVSVKQGGGFRKLPIIPSVPVASFSMGRSGIFIKPMIGMDVLLLCSEVSLDNFMISSNFGNASDGRKFSLTDAVVICGLSAEATRYEPKNPVEIRTETASVQIDDLGNVILNDGKTHAVSYEQLLIAFNTLKAEFDAIASIVGKPPSLADMTNSKVDKVLL